MKHGQAGVVRRCSAESGAWPSFMVAGKPMWQTSFDCGLPTKHSCFHEQWETAAPASEVAAQFILIYYGRRLIQLEKCTKKGHL